MSGQIYLIDTEGQLIPMQEEAYLTEDVLQQLLASHPGLLAGNRVSSTEPRRWFLVDREFGVPDDYHASYRWSLDHLFIDQDAIPTLVEVKRSTDTRLRREVVGQMLDYAANAISHWTIERTKAACERREDAGGDRLLDFIGGEQSEAEFWQRVDSNLQAGRIRLVFVADAIQRELARIIEFLNAQMDRTEVLGVELKQYVNGSLKTLVPSVVGQSAIAQSRKSHRSSDRVPVDRTDFERRAEAVVTDAGLASMNQLIDWCEAAGLDPAFRRGSHESSFLPAFTTPSGTTYPISLKHHGQLVFQMRFLKSVSPFDVPATREELCRRLETISRFDLRGGMEGLPFVPMGSGLTKENMESLLQTLEWLQRKLNVCSTDPA